MEEDNDVGYVDPFENERPTPDSYFASESRYFSAHHLLLDTARCALQRPSEDLAGQRRAAVTAIIMSDLAPLPRTPG